MIKTFSLYTLVLCAALLVALFATDFARAASHEKGSEKHLLVVINRANPLTDISRKDLRRILVREKRTWADGSEIALVLSDTQSSLLARILKTAAKMNLADFQRGVLMEQYQGGQGGKPILRFLDSADACMEVVVRNVHAITLIEEGEPVYGQLPGNLKVLTIEGKAFSDAGYGL